MTDGVKASELDRYVRIERPVSDTSLDGAGSGSWALVDKAWAGIKDLPAMRGERESGGATTVVRSARVRLRYREDLTPAMRIVDGDRVLQFAGALIEIGRRAGLEVIAEEHLPAGNPA